MSEKNLEKPGPSNQNPLSGELDDETSSKSSVSTDATIPLTDIDSPVCGVETRPSQASKPLNSAEEISPAEGKEPKIPRGPKTPPYTPPPGDTSGSGSSKASDRYHSGDDSSRSDTKTEPSATSEPPKHPEEKPPVYESRLRRGSKTPSNTPPSESSEIAETSKLLATEHSAAGSSRTDTETEPSATSEKPKSPEEIQLVYDSRPPPPVDNSLTAGPSKRLATEHSGDGSSRSDMQTETSETSDLQANPEEIQLVYDSRPRRGPETPSNAPPRDNSGIAGPSNKLGDETCKSEPGMEHSSASEVIKDSPDSPDENASRSGDSVAASFGSSERESQSASEEIKESPDSPDEDSSSSSGSVVECIGSTESEGQSASQEIKESPDSPDENASISSVSMDPSSGVVRRKSRGNPCSDEPDKSPRYEPFTPPDNASPSSHANEPVKSPRYKPFSPTDDASASSHANDPDKSPRYEPFSPTDDVSASSHTEEPMKLHGASSEDISKADSAMALEAASTQRRSFPGNFENITDETLRCSEDSAGKASASEQASIESPENKSKSEVEPMEIDKSTSEDTTAVPGSSRNRRDTAKRHSVAGEGLKEYETRVIETGRSLHQRPRDDVQEGSDSDGPSPRKRIK